MGKKTLYDQMKSGCINHRSRRPKEIEGNRASPSIIKARLKELSRDPASHDESRAFLTDRHPGVRSCRHATPVSYHPVVRWLAAQHMREWNAIELELQDKLRDMPKYLRRRYIPMFDGNTVSFWGNWIIGEVDSDGIFHNRYRTENQGSKTIRLFDELDESKLPHLAEGWYIGALGNNLYWFKLVEKDNIAYMGEDGRLRIMKRPSFPQGPKLTTEEAAHFRRLRPSTQKLLCDRQHALYTYYVKAAA